MEEDESFKGTPVVAEEEEDGKGRKAGSAEVTVLVWAVVVLEGLAVFELVTAEVLTTSVEQVVVVVVAVEFIVVAVRGEVVVAELDSPTPQSLASARQGSPFTCAEVPVELFKQLPDNVALSLLSVASLPTSAESLPTSADSWTGLS